MSEAEALKSLGAFPLVQGALFVMVVLAGIWVFLRGTRDGKSGIATVPQWLMIGPAHDVMGAVHDIAEQIRKQTDVLERIEDHCRHTADNTRQCTQVLEAIRNESRLR